MPVYIVMLGPPGAGKGTQAEILSQKLGLAHISSGNIFRENIKNQTELGVLVKDILKRGELVPDDLTNKMIGERLKRPDYVTGAVLDGFPRTLAQAEKLDEILLSLGGSLASVPYIQVGEDVLIERLTGRWTCRKHGHIFHTTFNPPATPGVCDFDGSELYQRDDDRRETVEKRIRVYLEQTAPLVEHYREQKKLVEINGDQPIEAITQDLLKALPGAGGGA